MNFDERKDTGRINDADTDIKDFAVIDDDDDAIAAVGSLFDDDDDDDADDGIKEIRRTDFSQRPIQSSNQAPTSARSYKVREFYSPEDDKDDDFTAVSTLKTTATAVLDDEDPGDVDYSEYLKTVSRTNQDEKERKAANSFTGVARDEERETQRIMDAARNPAVSKNQRRDTAAVKPATPQTRKPVRHGAPQEGGTRSASSPNPRQPASSDTGRIRPAAFVHNDEAPQTAKSAASARHTITAPKVANGDRNHFKKQEEAARESRNSAPADIRSYVTMPVILGVAVFILLVATIWLFALYAGQRRDINAHADATADLTALENDNQTLRIRISGLEHNVEALESEIDFFQGQLAVARNHIGEDAWPGIFANAGNQNQGNGGQQTINPTPSPLPDIAPFSHVVLRGETLSGIARQYNISHYRYIMEINPQIARPQDLQEGQTILIPRQ
ncbi:MAG: LysM peptidoglycan-binding domain-containing protein [Defluviitaleaceae bacterium]|nr:LysM peptidoglycan-binding domain-containing protein [Defluviitaleaceae bacterium]